MTTRWRLRPHDPTRISALSRGASLSPLVAQVPAQPGDRRAGPRGRSSSARMRACTTPSCCPARPRRPSGSSGAVRVGAEDRHLRRLRRRRRLRHQHPLGLPAAGRAAGDVDYYIPHRVDEGYGVNAEALRRLATENRADADRHGRLRDLGRPRGAAGRRAGRRADRHRPPHHRRRPARGRRDRPPAAAGQPVPLRRPLRRAAWRSSWPGRSARASATARRPRPTSATSWSGRSALVALATVADVVPLADENRILVRHGLAGIFAAPTVGLRALMEVSGCLGKKRLTTGTVGFGLAPRINAAGRLEARDEGRRDAHDRRHRPGPRDRRGARPLQHRGGRRSSRRSSTRPTR